MSLLDAIAGRFGFQRSAPQLPDKRADGALTEILPPFGTNPPTGPVGNSGNVEIRSIHSDPRELWYLNLPQKLTPQQVAQILRSALGGDIWQQWQLNSLMLDTWPMFRKCSHELRDAASMCKFRVKAFAVDGDVPTESATEKANMARRALANFNPNPFNDEEGLSGGIYDFCDALLNGLTLTEIIWQKPRKVKGFGMERYPQGLCWVHPRHFTFTNDGQVAVFDDNYAREYYKLAAVPTLSPDPRKFICSQFKSRSGSSLGAGLMRPLAYDWSAVMFNREWLLKSAQTHGSPFVDITYTPGINQADLQKLDQEVQSGLANRYIRHVQGTTLNVHPGQAVGSQNSQKDLMEMADKHCAELFLGQEGTTKSTPGSLGGGDESKDKTKRERVQGLAEWVAKDPLQQLVRAIILVNYGNDDECPLVECDFTEQETPLDAARRMQILTMPNMPPIAADDYYNALNIHKPEDGDQVILHGKIGMLENTESPIDPNPTPLQSPHYDANGNPMFPPSGGEPTEDDESEAIAARGGSSIDFLLGKASDADKKELLQLVNAAEQAPHLNGEVAAVKAKLRQIKRRAKI